jgi:bifunctional polynucleotide phosphatase/kinase
MNFKKDNSINFYVNNIPVRHKYKIAGFDWDHTIVKPKTTIHPRNEDDWILCYKTVINKFKQLLDDDYLIVIFSNQSNIDKPNRQHIILNRIYNIFNTIPIPNLFFISNSDDINRKPNKGMWEYMEKLLKQPIDLENSFYVGDAGGREYPDKKPDFSCSDRYFAYNLGINYKTPEEFFNEDFAKNYVTNLYPLEKFKDLKDSNRFNGNQIINKNIAEIILMVGYPSSGKSTFSKKYFVNNGYKYINQDLHKSQCLTMCKTYAKNNDKIVIDNTNGSIKSRVKYINIAKEYNLPIRCFYFNIDIELALHLNNYRMLLSGVKKLPKVAYYTFRKYFELPTKNENLDDVVYVNFVPEFNNLEEQYLFYQYS